MSDTPVSDVELASAALTDGWRLGAFFALTPDHPESTWRRLPELCDDEVLAERVAVARGTIARSAGVSQHAIAPRVAASVLSLGIFARLLSPPLGAALTHGILPVVTARDVWWQPVSGGLLPVAMTPSGTSWQGDAGTLDGLRTLAAAFEEAVLGQLVEPVVAAFRRLGVSPVVLRGNVISAVGGAVTMLDRPDYTGWELVKLLVAKPFLLDTAVVADHRLRRRSCCLFYRVPGTDYCGDCVLIGGRQA